MADLAIGSTVVDPPKLYVPLNPCAALSPVPLRALYALSEPTPARRRAAGRIAIERLSAGAACLELIRNTFNTIVLDRDRLARQFAFASRLAGVVPVRRLSYPRSLRKLPAVCEAVLADWS